MKTKRLSIICFGVLVLAALLSSCAPSVPHSVAERKECVTCHGNAGVKPYPAWHAKSGYGNDDCSGCHRVKVTDRNVAGAVTE
jgi:ABC-type oligopeptide transport system substrate-binding subunit